MRQADRIIVNVLSNYGLTLLAGVASMVLVPIAIRDLTLSGYGLAAMLVAIFAVIDTLGGSISRAMQRRIPHDLASQDRSGVNKTFSSAMVGYAILGLLGAATVWLVRDWYLDDPGLDEGLRADGRMAFAILAGALLAASCVFAFRAGLESIQRFDLVVAHIGAGTLLRMVALIVLFNVGLGSVALFVGTHVLAVMGSCMLCRRALRKEIPQLAVSPRFLSKAIIGAVLALAGANLLILVGNIMGNEGFRVLVGKGLGMEEVGGLSAVWTFRAMVFTLIRNMTNVLSPAVSALDARGSDENIAKLLLASTKYSVVAAASICVVPIFVAAPFLKLWLGPDAEGLFVLLYVVLAAQVFVSLGGSSQQVMVGLGRLKFTGPIVFTRGALSLLVAGAYIRFVEPSLTGAAACLYTVLGIGHLVIFLHGARATGIPLSTALVNGLARPLVLGMIGAATTGAVAIFTGADQWWRLGACVVAGEAVFVILVIAVGLDQEERIRVLSFLRRARSRVFPAARTPSNQEES